ncbi:hypothetical protein [Halovivax gelatinilyticus]|uniref:hypothetical protein n=1 Tax=Halovivax gelatinilyticus TaxID=2961597 RepID=UPI0020CA7D58|nr:hypothetical protein [Halovivax gelatinilyticus]
MGEYDRVDHVGLGLAGVLIVAALLEWISIESGSAAGVDSRYGLVVLGAGVVLAGATLAGLIERGREWVYLAAGFLTFAMVIAYVDALFPQEEPPYTPVHLPDGTTAPTTTMSFEPGLVLAGLAGGGLVMLAIAALLGLVGSD